MANFPNSLPMLREVENDAGVAYDAEQTNVVFAEDVNDIAAEILAIATELGTLPKGGFADVKARLADMTSKTASAQSAADRKGKKITNLMRYLWFNGESGQRNTGSATLNTAYPILGFSGSSPYTATIDVEDSDNFINVIVTFECLMWTTSLVWVEARLVVDGTPHGGWSRLFGSGSEASVATMTTGLSLEPGVHTISVEVRLPDSNGVTINYDKRNLKIFEVINS